MNGCKRIIYWEIKIRNISIELKNSEKKKNNPKSTLNILISRSYWDTIT